MQHVTLDGIHDDKEKTGKTNILKIKMQHVTLDGIYDDTEKTNTLYTLSSLHQADDKSLHILVTKENIT